MTDYEAMTNEELARKFHTGIFGEADKEITDDYALTVLLKKNRRFLIRQINRYKAGYDCMGIKYEELICEAERGLWTAVVKYDATRKTKLLTYARYWIEKGIREFLEKDCTYKKKKKALTEVMSSEAVMESYRMQHHYTTESTALKHLFMNEVYSCIESMPIRDQLILSLRNGMHGCTPISLEKTADLFSVNQFVLKKDERRIYQELYRYLIEKHAIAGDIKQLRQEKRRLSEQADRAERKHRREGQTSQQRRRILEERREENAAASAGRIPELFENDDPETAGEADKEYYFQYSDGSRVYIPYVRGSIYTMPEFNRWRVLYQDKDEEWIRRRYRTLLRLRYLAVTYCDNCADRICELLIGELSPDELEKVVDDCFRVPTH